MVTAAKVFIILGMVFGWPLILPLVFGGITLSKLSTTKKAEELMVWGILDILFCGIIGGILVLLIKDEDLAESHTSNA